MKKLAKEYDLTTIPDKIELRKQLSEANKLRHQFWNQLRAVRNQIGRYVRAHEISENDFMKLIKPLPKNKREFFGHERQAGKDIPVEELEQMFHTTNLLWNTSQFKENLRRKRGKASLLQDIFFQGRPCKNCGLPLTGTQRKFCSTICGDQHRKRKDAEKRRKKKQTGLNIPKKQEGQEIKSQEGPNPQPGSGEKRESCKYYYPTCVDKAIIWEDFNCEKCKLKNIKI